MSDFMRTSEFREEGYLQELNRVFLHPLGMALVVRVDEQTNCEVFMGVVDYRDVPGGMNFTNEFLHSQEFKEKTQRVLTEQKLKHEVRLAKLGYVVQPAPEEKDGK